MPKKTLTPAGARRRHGALRVGDRVQLTDAKGRHHTITLEAGKDFHTHRGVFAHDALIGQPEGSVVTNTAGFTYLALRPLLRDYVLSMPRGAAVIYPKDAWQIVNLGDVFSGARVVEAGVGSGGLSMALLRAIGDDGQLISIERREDFAEVAKGNVRGFFGEDHPAWTVEIGDFADVVVETCEPGSVDCVVLDMLAPWENLDAAATILAPGGVFVSYVATTTQLSRLAEGLREHGGFTEPEAMETMLRTWHLEGLAVRPDHRMVGHTGFLLSSRRMAPGATAPLRKRRPAKGSYPVEEEWTPEDLGERPVSQKKVRKARRKIVKKGDE